MLGGKPVQKRVRAQEREKVRETAKQTVRTRQAESTRSGRSPRKTVKGAETYGCTSTFYSDVRDFIMHNI